MTIYVDSNYWIYWMDRRHPEHNFVIKSIRSAIREGIILNVITLLEVAHYLRTLGEPEFTSRMENLRNLRTLTLTELNMTTFHETLSVLSQYGRVGIGARDAVIVATMRLYGVKRILTHDRDFRKIKGIRVIDPIPQRI